LTLARIFSDHAVLQRDTPLRIWGQTAPNASVTVSLAQHSGSTTSDFHGHWIVSLPPLPAGGPHELLALSGNHRAGPLDILIGDV